MGFIRFLREECGGILFLYLTRRRTGGSAVGPSTNPLTLEDGSTPLHLEDGVTELTLEG